QGSWTMTDGTAASRGRTPVLSVRDLRVTFPTSTGPAPAVRGVDFDLYSGEALAIVGESGSGKSVTMLAMLGLLGTAAVTGSAKFGDTELVGLDPAKLRAIRGSKVSMIFQDPMTSLNPVLTVGRQLSLVMRAHDPKLSKAAAVARAVDLFEQVAISRPQTRVHSYPHELSGGMRQRVMIAMAIANRPEVLIADEPTTALDVTVQAQIMELLGNLREEHNLALVLITHDLGVVAGATDRVNVMYAGRVVETGPVGAVFRVPVHPYTRGLLECLPRLDARQEVQVSIPGMAATPQSLPSGCPFHPRCRYAIESCADVEPSLEPIGETLAACSVMAAVAAR
ncbi:MAG TPA: ABC transporter ATP-binding protein, partial [Ilumatobacteraceae bacterium]|nr:ABC transporter ATP-binding protein [Ilumatobacteraceae bacterium]